MQTDLELLVTKAREVRTVLLQAGQSVEMEAKREVAILDLTEKIVVFRELLIQGKVQVGPRVADFFKSKTYGQFVGNMEVYIHLTETEPYASTEYSTIRGAIVGFIEDFLLSI